MRKIQYGLRLSAEGVSTRVTLSLLWEEYRAALGS